MWPVPKELRAGNMASKLAVCVMSPWGSFPPELMKVWADVAKTRKKLRIFCIDMEMCASDDTQHPHRKRACKELVQSTSDATAKLDKYKALLKYAPSDIMFVIAGAELFSLLSCRRTLNEISLVSKTASSVSSIVALVGARRMQLTGQVGQPFVELLRAGKVPVSFNTAETAVQR
jgi:hypothetical protein